MTLELKCGQIRHHFPIPPAWLTISTHLCVPPNKMQKLTKTKNKN